MDGRANYVKFRYSQLKALHQVLTNDFSASQLAPFPTMYDVQKRQVASEKYLQHICASEKLSQNANFVKFMQMDSLIKDRSNATMDPLGEGENTWFLILF